MVLRVCNKNVTDVTYIYIFEVRIRMINKLCQYFPCHLGVDEKDFSCKYCSCPLYPCLDKTKGYFLNNGLWDCQYCTLNHTKDFEEAWEYSQKHLS